MHRANVLTAACAAGLLALALAATASAGGDRDRGASGQRGPATLPRLHWRGYGDGGRGHRRPPQPPPAEQPTGTTPPVGTVRPWPQVDVTTGGIDFRDFTLRGVGAHSEVWVANDLSFPAGDCRNGERPQVTDAQVRHLIGQFEGDVYPRESAAFSVPPQRDGSNGAPGFAFGGQSNRVVILVDNIRDPSFYDPNDAQNLPYLGGFFDPSLAEGTDRNVLTLDSFDWLHRLGASPPSGPPAPGCTPALPRPYFYEALLAHEYQNLLEYYADPGEELWMRELLAEYAETLTGYTNPALPIASTAFDGTTQAFLGWLSVPTPANPSPRPGGPENSVTLWGDEGPDEILSDYGAVHTLAQLLADRYGVAFMTALHRDSRPGLGGLADVMRRFGVRGSTADLIHDWAVAVALDARLDDGAQLDGGRRERDFEVRSLHASVNWDNPEAYDSPGVPPNGSDYVRLRDSGGRYVTARDLQSLVFDGARGFPVEWTVADGALASGSGDGLDRAIVRQVTVPAADPTLTFRTRYDIEQSFDYGFVQVSTDGGATWSSLGNADANVAPDPSANAKVVASQPGFSGLVPDWRDESFDLSAYAGQTVLVAFRYVTDEATEGNPDSPIEPGWEIDDVSLGGTLVSDGSALDGWLSPTQARPASFGGFTVQLVSYESDGRRASVATLPVDAGQHVALDARALRKLVDPRADVVAAIVTLDDPDESSDVGATYRLTANGVVQPGGG